MTDYNELDTLRIFAKRLVRKHSIAHHEALDVIAKQQGHLHWNALMGAWSKGWRPDAWGLIDINEPVDFESPVRAPGKIKTTEGKIAGKPYTLEVGFTDVLIGGEGWTIYLDHAPSIPAEISKRTKPNPLDDKTFFLQVMKIAMDALDGVREAMRSDWGLRAMVPDSDGCVSHPLFSGGVSAEWHCMHCEGRFSGSQMIANMWHCPKCSATPLDIHAAPFWRQDKAV